MKKLFGILLIAVMVIGLVGCGKQEYTENILKARDHYQPWYLSSKLTGGEVYDKALKNQKWEDTGDQVIVTGIDRKTNKKVVVTYDVKGDRVDMKTMTLDGESKTYYEWYKYMTGYID